MGVFGTSRGSLPPPPLVLLLFVLASAAVLLAVLGTAWIDMPEGPSRPGATAALASLPPPVRLSAWDTTGLPLGQVQVRLREADEEPAAGADDPSWRTAGWTTERGLLLPRPARDLELLLRAEGRVPQRRILPRGDARELRIVMPPAPPAPPFARILLRVEPSGAFLEQLRARLVLDGAEGPLWRLDERGRLDVQVEVGPGYEAVRELQVWCGDGWSEDSALAPPAAATLLHRADLGSLRAGEVADLGVHRFQPVLWLRAEVEFDGAPDSPARWLLLVPGGDWAARDAAAPLLQVADAGTWPPSGRLEIPLSAALADHLAWLLLVRGDDWNLSEPITLRPGWNEFAELGPPGGVAVSGLVLDPQDRPLADRRVRLDGRQIGGAARLPAVLAERLRARSDEDGRFAFPIVPPGRWRLRVEQEAASYDPVLLLAGSRDEVAVGQVPVSDLLLRASAGLTRWTVRLELPEELAALATGPGTLWLRPQGLPASVDPPDPIPWRAGGLTLALPADLTGALELDLDAGVEQPWVRASGRFEGGQAGGEAAIVLAVATDPVEFLGPPGGTATVLHAVADVAALARLRARIEAGRPPLDGLATLRLDAHGRRQAHGLPAEPLSVRHFDANGRPTGRQEIQPKARR